MAGEPFYLTMPEVLTVELTAGLSPGPPLKMFSWNAYAAPVTFLNTLVTEFSERNAETTERSLKQFEAYAEEAGLFAKSVGRV